MARQDGFEIDNHHNIMDRPLCDVFDYCSNRISALKKLTITASSWLECDLSVPQQYCAVCTVVRCLFCTVQYVRRTLFLAVFPPFMRTFSLSLPFPEIFGYRLIGFDDDRAELPMKSLSDSLSLSLFVLVA